MRSGRAASQPWTSSYCQRKPALPNHQRATILPSIPSTAAPLLCVPKGFSCMSATSPTPTPHLFYNCPISDSPSIGESHECTASLSRRSHCAPSIFSEIKEPTSPGLNSKCPRVPSAPSMVKQAFIGVSLYVSIGVIVYMVKSGSFEGHTTFRLVDALYFSIVALGYGDMVHDTVFTKLFTCVFILVGFGFVDILLDGVVTYVVDKQEAVLLSSLDEDRRNMVFKRYVIWPFTGHCRNNLIT